MSLPKTYFTLISLEVGLLAIKYEGLSTNPFQQSSPICFLFLTSLFCHAVSTMADMSYPTTKIIFHFSGVIGCEALLWILLPESRSWYIINIFILVVTSFCFFNCIEDIIKLFLLTHTNAVISITQPLNLEPREASASLALDL